ncbi:hypothetical protein OMF40_20635, partial [Bordetella pertussis]
RMSTWLPSCGPHGGKVQRAFLAVAPHDGSQVDMRGGAMAVGETSQLHGFPFLDADFCFAEF